MKTTRHYLSATLGFVLLGTIVAFSLPQTGHSSATQSTNKDVRVINMATEAVPVRLTGTQNINIANSPTVTVENGESDPVIVRDADRSVPRPFQYEVEVKFEGTLAIAQRQAPIPIPSGKMAVVENVSVFGTATNFAAMTYHIGIATRIQPDVDYRFHRLNVTRFDPPYGESEFTASQMVKIYSDTPELFARVVRMSSNPDHYKPATFKFIVSGYLIDRLQD